jgi:hypothetical protein
VPDPDVTQTDVNGFGGIFNMPSAPAPSRRGSPPTID